MRRACACLMAGRNVQETSGDMGYESQHGFSLAFKKFFGYPPSLHRKTMEDGKWKSKVEGRETRASEGRARHSVRAEPPQHAKSEIGNRKSEIIVVGRKSAFDKIKSNREALSEFCRRRGDESLQRNTPYVVSYSFERSSRAWRFSLPLRQFRFVARFKSPVAHAPNPVPPRNVAPARR